MAEVQFDKDDVIALQGSYEDLKAELGKKIIGQEETIRLLLTAIFCQGHCLLVGVPGLAKTLLIQTLSEALNLDFSRIQFTPDLMPSDIVGAETLDRERNLKFVQGPIFANIVLADEINRTPPKTQAALLESMQEYAVTVGGKRYALDRPFFVLATQNPIEQEGTYPLPEAQLDRFMFNIQLGYPSLAEELKIVAGTTTNLMPEINTILSGADISRCQQLIRQIPVSDNVIEYAVKLAHKTRPGQTGAAAEANEYLDWGAGPRASQFLVLGAKGNAALNGKFSPDIEDIRAVAVPILRHRIVRNFKAEAEGITIENLIERIL